MALLTWKKIGVSLPGRLVVIMQRKEVVAVVSACDPDCWPRGMPVLFLLPAAETGLYLAVPNDAECAADVFRDGRLALTFLEEGDCLFSVRGKAILARRALASDEGLAALAVTIEETVELRLPGFIVSQGVRVEKREHGDRLLYRRVMQELRELAAQGGKTQAKGEWSTSEEGPPGG